MAQQTAVEWFYQRILAKDIKEVYAQAKQMEKEQIMEASKISYLSGMEKSPYDTTKPKDFAEEYYNETYAKRQDSPDKDDIK